MSYATPYLLFYESTTMNSFPVLTKEELLPNHSQQQDSKKAFFRLLGLDSYFYLLYTCIKQDINNTALISLCSNYILQVPIYKKPAYQNECEELLEMFTSSLHNIFMAEAACCYHSFYYLLYYYFKLTAFEKKLYDYLYHSITYYLSYNSAYILV